jgi:zinc D-Ala-D-Ala dipeptidase
MKKEPVQVKTAQRSIPQREFSEPLIRITEINLPRIRINLATYAGMNVEEQMYLRASVIEKLNAAQRYLDKNYGDENLHIELRSAFRSMKGLEILKAEHERRYEERRTKGEIDESVSKEEYVKSMLAIPSVSRDPGHMTGGAVDVRLCGPNGERIHLEESDKVDGHIPRDRQYPTRSQEVEAKHPEMMRLRLILLEAMEKQGFHNNKDEYWHYSYGDADWARQNNCEAIYKIPKS